MVFGMIYMMYFWSFLQILQIIKRLLTQFQEHASFSARILSLYWQSLISDAILGKKQDQI